MKNKVIIVLIGLFFSCAKAENTAYSLKSIQPKDFEVFVLENELKTVYLQSFNTVYKEYWTNELESAVLSSFDTYISKFKRSQDIFLIVTLLDTTVSGWALFYIEHESERAILELICVAPEHWRKGLGKRLIASIKTYYPTIKSIAVVSRKINIITPQFYQSLGFKKTNFMLPEYNTEDVQGYELELPNNSGTLQE